MRKLVFKEVSILSKVEKAGRTETFNPTINLITGEHDVGKSTLIKSLYHTLGADVPGLQNKHWKDAKPIYCLRFGIDGEEYTIVRDEKYFGAFDSKQKLVGRFVGISGERGFARFLNPILNFRIELERAEDEKLGLAGPAFYFLPFYIDQDEGWTKSWDSFLGLQQFSAYRKNMLEYHLGIRPQSYYDAKKNFVELTNDKAKISAERMTLASVREAYEKRKSVRQLDIDPAVFREEAEELVEQFNKVYGRQQDAAQELKDVGNERHGLENEIVVLQRAIGELDSDYAFAEDPITSDIVACPTCGTEIANSIVERFGILHDIDYCYNLIDQRKKKLVDVIDQQKAADSKYKAISAELAPIQELLKRKKENVTFAEFVAAEGMKDIVSSMTTDINALAAREDDLRKSIEGLEEVMKLDSKRKRQINEFYQARMKEFLANLSVNVLSMDDYKTIEKQIKTNALGSDLPRSLLAQHFAFLHTMTQFNPSIACPLVIDSPLQQEQDTGNISAIFSFIFSRVTLGQQLFLGTLHLDDVPKELIPTAARSIHLSQELHLLEKDQYADVFDRIGKMHEETLAASTES
jgi:predicted  nucleic acid-binding Zn-ribbon protein